MFAIITIFLISFLAAAIAIWLYRRASGWQGSDHTLVNRTDPPARTKMGLQQGFISLTSTRRERVKTVKLRGSQSGIKAPWGW